MSHSLLAKVSLKKSSLILETVITEVKISMTHLLIVDDEKDIVDICQTYFEYEGYQVTTTTCGKEALKLLSSDIDYDFRHYDAGS